MAAVSRYQEFGGGAFDRGGELNELFLWKDVAASEAVEKEKIKEELADVLAYALLLAEKQGLDVKQIVLDKIAKNSEKYPVEKARGSAQKYTEL